MPGMRDGSTTDDYRAALSGEGDWWSLGYEWSAKPHRLVYDLCSEVDRLRACVLAYSVEFGGRIRTAPGQPENCS